MTKKIDSDSTSRAKVLKLYRKLLAESKEHYLSDLAIEFSCSRQTILRLILSIENEIGTSLETGKNGTRRWFKINPKNL